MELKNSQIHPSPKGKGLLWQEDKEVKKSKKTLEDSVSSVRT